MWHICKILVLPRLVFQDTILHWSVTKYLTAKTDDFEFFLRRHFRRKFSNQLQNIGSELLSARLAKGLNLFITSLTICFSNAREHVAKSWQIRHRQPIKTTAEVQGNCPHNKRKLDGKMSSTKSTKASPCLATAVSEQQGSKIWQLGR